MEDGNVVPLFPQGRGRTYLLEQEVRTETLVAALQAAVIDTKIDGNGDIYITDGLDVPMWIIIDHKSHLICMHLCWSSKCLLEDINELNATYRIVKFTASADNILANYHMTFRYGFDTRHFIAMSRHFASICRHAFGELKQSHKVST